MTESTYRYSAPDDIRYCCRCGSNMVTREIAGKPRRACAAPDCGYIHFIEPKVGVGVMVVHHDRLLLIKRGMPPELGRWSLPAGYIDIGEAPAEVAVREAREETGLTVTVTGLIGVYHNPPEQGGAALFILYRARLAGPARPRPGDDAAEAAFFSLDALPPLAFASTFDAVERLRQNLAAGCQSS